MSKEFKTIYLKVESQAELNLLYSAMSVGVTDHARKFKSFDKEILEQMMAEEYELYTKIQDLVFQLEKGEE